MTRADYGEGASGLGWPEPVVDLLEAIAASWRAVMLVLLVGGVATVLWICMAPPFYVSSAVAVLMPREKPTLDISVNTSLLRTSESGARRASAAPLMLPPQPGLYVELLYSDRVIVGIAELLRTQLDQSGELSVSDAATALRDMVKVVGTEEGLLTVEVTAASSDLAALVANELLAAGESTSRLIERNLVLEQAKHLESAIGSANRELAADEAKLRKFYGTHGMLDPQQESTENLRQIRETSMLRDKLQRELGERELQFATGEVGVKQLQRQIEIADGRLLELQKRTATAASGESYGALFVSHNRLQERIRGRRDLLQTLDAQHMILGVRLDQPAGSLVRVKRAVAPKSPAGPRKKRIVLVGAAVTMAIAVLLAILLRQWRHAQSSGSFRDRLRMIRQHLPTRSRDRRTTG